MTPDERDLIAAAVAGDETAFGELVKRSMPRALAFARQMTGSQEDAEDVVQEAYVKAYRSLSGFRGDSGFYTWFYRLLANACLDHLRKAAVMNKLLFFRRENKDEDERDPVEDAPDPNAGSSPEALVMGKELKKALNRALMALPGRQRAVFLLKHNEGLKISEIALALGISEGAVKSHLSRAVASLSTSMKDYRGGRNEALR